MAQVDVMEAETAVILEAVQQRQEIRAKPKPKTRPKPRRVIPSKLGRVTWATQRKKKATAKKLAKPKAKKSFQARKRR